MIPYLVIVVAGLVGLFGWGLKGGVLGAVGAWILSLILGGVVGLLSGGLLPRKVRREAASGFISSYGDLARGVFPNALEPALQKSVEHWIERIFRRAARDSESMDLEAALERAAIQAAAAALIAEEPRPQMKSFLTALEEHIEKEMYP